MPKIDKTTCPKVITADMLSGCDAGLRQFRRRHPKGLPVTTEAFQREALRIRNCGFFWLTPLMTAAEVRRTKKVLEALWSRRRDWVEAAFKRIRATDWATRQEKRDAIRRKADREFWKAGAVHLCHVLHTRDLKRMARL